MKKSVVFLFPILMVTACQKPQESSVSSTNSSQESGNPDITLLTEIEQPTYYDYDSSSKLDVSSSSEELVYQNISSVLNWVNDIDASSVSRITFTDDVGSVGPTMNRFDSHKDMTDSSSIADFVTEMKSLRVASVQESYWTGGGSYSFTLHTMDGEEYTLEFNNGSFTAFDGDYYYYYAYESFIDYENKPWGEPYYSFIHLIATASPLFIQVYVDGIEHSEIDTLPFFSNVNFRETTETIVQDEKYSGYSLAGSYGETLTPLTDTAFSLGTNDGTKIYTIINPEDVDCSLLLLEESC